MFLVSTMLMRDLSFHRSILIFCFSHIVFYTIIPNCNSIIENNRNKDSYNDIKPMMNHDDLKNSIFEWWKENNVSKPLKCSRNIKSSNQNKLLKFLRNLVDNPKLI